MTGGSRTQDESARAAASASLALLAFAALSSLALIGWARTTEGPWGWKGVLTAICIVASTVVSALVWWKPRRSTVLAGAAVLLASLARVGGPGSFTWASFALVAGTVLLLMPLVRAVLVLPDDR